MQEVLAYRPLIWNIAVQAQVAEDDVREVLCGAPCVWNKKKPVYIGKTNGYHNLGAGQRCLTLCVATESDTYSR